MILAAREAEREGPGLGRCWSEAVAVAVVSPITPKPVPKTMLFDLDLDLVFDREASLKRPKTERGRSVAAAAVISRSVSLTSPLTVSRAAGVIGREGRFAGAGIVVVVVVLFSVVSVMVEAEAGCEVVLLEGRFLG